MHPLNSPLPEAADPAPWATPGRKRRIIVGLSAVVVALLIGLAAVKIFATEQWDPLLEPYVAFIEAERGLSFREPVDVRWADIGEELLAEAAAEEAARDDGASSAGRDPWGEAHMLLGLVDPNPETSSEDAANETVAENAVAFYNLPSETIVLQEGTSGPELAITLVHELTHALQHQNGMLGLGSFDTEDGRAARRAIIEGDAERVEVAWFRQQPEADQQAYWDAVGYDPDAEVADPGDSFYETSFFATYDIGYPMVNVLVEIGGIDALNTLLRAKDVGTTERLIDPLATTDRSIANALTDAHFPDGRSSVGDLGALTWFQALAPVVGTEAAFDALIGYDDDAFSTFVTDDGTPCGYFALFFDTGPDTREFADIVEQLSVTDVSFGTNDLDVEFMICDPIGDPELQRLGAILPLVVANDATVTHLRNGVSPEVARCAAIAQAKTIPADVPLGNFVGWDVVEEQATK